MYLCPNETKIFYFLAINLQPRIVSCIFPFYLILYIFCCGPLDDALQIYLKIEISIANDRYFSNQS